MGNNLNAQDARAELMARRTKFAVLGMLLALLSGVGQALNGSMTGVASGMDPFSNPTYGLWMIVICSFICSGLHDFFSGIWILIFNKCLKRTFTEYIRLLRTKVGWLLIVGAALGGPLATCGAMAATYLCGPTYSLAISGAYPIVGTLAAVIFLKEKITPRAWIGIIIAVVGVLTVSYSPPDGESYPYFAIGIIFALLCALGWGTEGTFITYAGDMIDPNIGVGTFRSFGSGLFILLIAVPITGFIGHVGIGAGFEVLGAAISEGTPILVMVIAALGGGSSMYFFYQALNMCGNGRGMCINITSSLWSIPICLILQAMGLMNYEVSPRALIGAGIIVIGTMLSIASPKDLVDLRNN